MSVLDQIAELERQKEQLLAGAKSEAIQVAEKAIAELNALGFSYRLVEGVAAPRATGTRRSGVRQDVLNAIKTNGPIARAALLEQMGVKGDKAGEQSVSNALAALKKAGEITSTDGNYEAA